MFPTAYNEIKIDGGIALTDAIVSLLAIQQFNLNGNELGNEGIEDIKVRMTTAGKYNVLGTFSDDEFQDDGEDDSYDPENIKSPGKGKFKYSYSILLLSNIVALRTKIPGQSYT